jgi:hypothetical protein
MKTVLRIVVVTLFAFVFCAALYAQNNNSAVVGTWKLNTAKSKFDPGPGPKSLTRKVEALGTDGVKYTFDGVASDGKALSYGFSVHFDGKDNPISGSMPEGADTISVKMTDAHHFVATLKKGGKEIGSAKVSVSEDGKVTTVDASGTNAAGAKTHNVEVFDKQ